MSGRRSKFRNSLFVEDGGITGLSLSGLKRMINRITPLGDRLVVELTGHFKAVCSMPTGLNEFPASMMVTSLPTAIAQIDFPEFLRLMRRLLDADFAQIKEKANSVVNASTVAE